MEKFSLFKRYWGDVGQKIESIVKRRSGARAYIPKPVPVQALGHSCYKLAFDSPAFFYNAPQKGSSTKSGASHRQAIFVDGTFTVCETEGKVTLTGATCNVSIYATEHIADVSYTLRLVDAMHFDMEDETQSEFHPMFHVQRGLSKTLTHEMIISRVVEATRLDPAKIHITGEEVQIGLSYVRLPTPQMDYFSVLAQVVADFFCSAGQSDRDTKEEFRALLRSLLGNRNMMRDGGQSQTLRKRWNSDMPFGAPHWYVESI